MSYDTNLRAAVAALIKAKGRHHTGIEYARLVAAFNAGETSVTGNMTSQYMLTAEKQAKMMEQYARDMMPIHDPIYDSRATTTAVRHTIKSDPRYDAEQMQLEMARRAATIADTSDMMRFDSSMTREQVAEKMRHVIKPDPVYDARCALQDRTDWSAA